MDNYFLVGYEYDSPVSLSALGRRASVKSARRDYELLKRHIAQHNSKLTSVALYRGLCWSLPSFVSGNVNRFDLVDWR